MALIIQKKILLSMTFLWLFSEFTVCFKNKHNWIFIYAETQLVKYVTVWDDHYSHSRRLSFLLWIYGLVSIFLKGSHVFTTCKIVWDGGEPCFLCKKENRKKVKRQIQLSCNILSDGNKKRVLMFNPERSSLWLTESVYGIAGRRALPQIKINGDALRNKWLRKSIQLTLHGNILCFCLTALFIFPTENRNRRHTHTYIQRISNYPFICIP